MRFWDWQLVRYYSPKSWSPPPVFPKDAGRFSRLSYLHVCSRLSCRIVEFGSQDDAQRSIRELSEQLLLGRPIFIREVCFLSLLLIRCSSSYRIAKMNHALEQPQSQARWVWRWPDRASTLSLLLDLLTITTSAAAAAAVLEAEPLILVISSTLATYVLAELSSLFLTAFDTLS